MKPHHIVATKVVSFAIAFLIGLAAINRLGVEGATALVIAIGLAMSLGLILSYDRLIDRRQSQ